MSDPSINTSEGTGASQTPVKKKRLSFLNRIMWLVNYAAVIGLLISYLAPYVSPANFWFIAFFGLGYPLLVVINVLFVFYWLIQLRPRFLVSLAAVLGGWIFLQTFVQVNLDATPPGKSKPRFKLMSYNVRLFDLYNWTHNKETRNKIFDLIKEEAPDIICMQEFYHSTKKGDFQNVDTLLKLQEARYHHVEYTLTMRGHQNWGIATFSAYPIVNKGTISFGKKANNICIYSDIKIDKDTVRIYNVHMQSIHFRPDDYKFIEQVMIDSVETDEIEGSKNILRRIKSAYEKRAQQAEQIARHISESPYPVIICGDFNDTPSSYVYHTISAGLEDAFMESGNGFGRTYGGKFPSFRIDYIMNDPKFRTYEFRTIKEELSDHFPVVCYFEMWED